MGVFWSSIASCTALTSAFELLPVSICAMIPGNVTLNGEERKVEWERREVEWERREVEWERREVEWERREVEWRGRLNGRGERLNGEERG